MIEALLESILLPIFHVLVRVPGLLFFRYVLRRTDVDIDSGRVVVVGLLIWVVVVSALVAAWFLV